MFDYFLLIAGLGLLLVGGDITVRGAVGLAEKLSIPPLIIGLTIVSFGTSAPELFISLNAALEGAGGLAVGNVVGSNIANVLLVLGVPALFRAYVCKEDGISRNLVTMLSVTIVFMGMLYKRSLEFFDGAILFGLLVLYLYSQFRTARKARKNGNGDSVGNDPADYSDEVDDVPESAMSIAFLLIVGLALLPIGAELTVSSATNLAKAWHVSDAIIGLTIVALGTSLPELATTLMAVLRNNSSVALGNIVGSNIFNIAAILGLTALITPLPVSDRIVSIDMWVMLAAALVVSLLAHYGKTLRLGGGLVLVASYCAYVVLVFV